MASFAINLWPAAVTQMARTALGHKYFTRTTNIFTAANNIRSAQTLYLLGCKLVCGDRAQTGGGPGPTITMLSSELESANTCEPRVKLLVAGL